MDDKEIYELIDKAMCLRKNQDNKKERVANLCTICSWDLVKKPIKKFFRKKICPICGNVLCKPDEVRHPKCLSVFYPDILIHYTCECGYEWAGYV
jgi:hypothetical protein